MYLKTLSVSLLNNYIKKNIDNDFVLNNANVTGEISNYKSHNSGHMYFSLKDDTSKINCVMFKSKAEELKFFPENGMKVVVKGRVSVYLKEGSYQLYCDEMNQEGLGDLYLKYLKLKSKLEGLGYFDDLHKKPIPTYVNNIGVITSATGAAVKDIINVIHRRNKGINLIIYPSLVQGIGASKDIIKGIKELNMREDIDLIILARGGGSIEELWSFNEEEVAQAVYDSKIPIITGVGHETDFTLVDFVSDRRAPTPSAAAELAAFSLDEANYKLLNTKKKLMELIDKDIINRYKYLDYIKKNLLHLGPEAYIANQYKGLDLAKEKLNRAIYLKLSVAKEKLIGKRELLEAQNPLKVLNRGYAIITDENNKLIKEKKELLKEGKIKISLRDGMVVGTFAGKEVI
ncbi:MAG TPA: exodeoxyribonuclease VII large subunit [Clostridiaceae bacterium]